MKRPAALLGLVLLVVAILYLPVKRALLDRGLIVAASFRSSDGTELVLWDNGRYRLGERAGYYSIDLFADAPWISRIKLDTGTSLYVRYADHVYQVEDIPELIGAKDRFTRR